MLTLIIHEWNTTCSLRFMEKLCPYLNHVLLLSKIAAPLDEKLIVSFEKGID